MIRHAALALVLSAVPALAESPRAIVTQCAPCHGDEGIARDTEVPHLAGQNERYLFNQMMAFKSGKRAHRDMRYMSRHLTTEEIEALAAYYSSLPR